MTHPAKRGSVWKTGANLTVDCDGNDFSQNPTVRSLVGRDLAHRVQSLVFSGEAIRRVGIDKFDVKVVLLRNGKEDSRSGVAL